MFWWRNCSVQMEYYNSWCWRWRCKPFTKYHESQSLLLTESITTVRSEIKIFSEYVSNPHPCLPTYIYQGHTLHKGGKIILTIKLIWFVVFLDKVFEGLRVSSHQPAKKPFWIFLGSKEWIDQMWGKIRNWAYNLHPKIFADYMNSFMYFF